MDWRAFIHSDAEVLLGKPVVRGTRLAADFVLGLLAAGWTEQATPGELPRLDPEARRQSLRSLPSVSSTKLCIPRRAMRLVAERIFHNLQGMLDQIKKLTIFALWCIDSFCT